jgi:hypothetical protein
MQFNWVNLFGAMVVVILLLPNIIYVLKNKGMENRCRNKAMNIMEQIGRYACIIFMWLPLFVWEFGFQSLGAFLFYIFGNTLLLTVYWILWVFYFKKPRNPVAMALAIIPTCIFLLSGLLLHYWLLIISAIVFGIGHIYVTFQNYD